MRSAVASVAPTIPSDSLPAWDVSNLGRSSGEHVPPPANSAHLSQQGSSALFNCSLHRQWNQSVPITSQTKHLSLASSVSDFDASADNPINMASSDSLGSGWELLDDEGTFQGDDESIHEPENSIEQADEYTIFSVTLVVETLLKFFPIGQMLRTRLKLMHMLTRR